jgi:GR25 family glycosyltransferase involved in LPS biosynthesis
VIDVLVVNLDTEIARFAPIQAQFAGHPGFNVSRSRGVQGGTLPDLVFQRLTGVKSYKQNIGAGTLGVFLAHVAVWERAAAAAGDLTLVLEDDVRLRNLHLLTEAAIPPDADLVFCNHRMEPLPQASRDGTRLAVVGIEESLRRLAERDSRAVGTDGYLLRRAGARKLLAAVEADLCFGHIDWRMLRYCVTDEQIAQVIPGTNVAAILHRRNEALKTRPGSIKAYVTAPALVIGTGAPSRRVAEDAVTK